MEGQDRLPACLERRASSLFRVSGKPMNRAQSMWRRIASATPSRNAVLARRCVRERRAPARRESGDSPSWGLALPATPVPPWRRIASAMPRLPTLPCQKATSPPSPHGSPATSAPKPLQRLANGPTEGSSGLADRFWTYLPRGIRIRHSASWLPPNSRLPSEA